ncbi:hypothetical protein F0U61_06100 [Archangium violaceum]|uniref:DUF7003 family protein n=1 Tax=Archangium violaceum TaxID=83451 RepID=UPI002B27E7D8|nr:hypothetical protein F0U61_06100 [Archangium violaceum]
MPLNASEILAMLDEAAARFTFPVLDNGYVYPADVRLSGFSSGAQWALVIEVLGFNTRAGGTEGFDVALYRLGNCIPKGKEGQEGFRLDFVFPVDDGPSGELLVERYGELISPAARDVLIRGKVVPLPAPEVYPREGIQLVEPTALRAYELLRALVPEHREQLLATDEELREELPRDMPLRVRWDAWRHPDVAGGERPSGLETFRQLAEALARGEGAGLVPPEPPNTHWSHWPLAGQL